MFLSKINDHICDVDNTYVARYIVWKNSKKKYRFGQWLLLFLWCTKQKKNNDKKNMFDL